MKPDSSTQPAGSNHDPNPEKWVTKYEILKQFRITERQLKYWRDTKKIRSKTIKQRTFYIVSDVQLQAKSIVRPRRFLGIDIDESEKKLRNIDSILFLLILAFAFAMNNGVHFSPHFFTLITINFPVSYFIIHALILAIRRTIKFLSKNRFKHSGMNNQNDLTV